LGTSAQRLEDPIVPKVLIVVTSHSEIDPDHKTGLWFEEYSIPRRIFREAGFDIVTASPIGGEAPVDPRSLENVQPDEDALAALAETETVQEAGTVDDYDAIFIPGGHGTMFDLAVDPHVKALLRDFDAEEKVIGAVCHGPAAFVGAKRDDGSYIVTGRRITAFTDSEERAVGLAPLMPFLLASKLRDETANVIEGADWADHVEVDDYIITGQNPQSSASTARAVVQAVHAHVH
jgi:putative intracellular protease/amidase